MVAHTSSCCDVVPTSTARRTRRRTVVPETTRPPTPAVAPRRPWRTTPRDKAAGNGKARTRRRCVEVRRKMEALRRLVPSGDGEGADDDGGRLGVDELLVRAAEYIMRLQVQVKVMQHMVDVLEYTKDQ